MGIGPCNEACPECPLWSHRPPKALEDTQEHGCYSDTDHVVPRYLARRVGATALLKNYIKSPVNQVQTCRWEHMQKTEREYENPEAVDIPTEQFMIDALKRVRFERRKSRQGIDKSSPE